MANTTSINLTILGATGKVGQEVVSQALASGHNVTVLVRDPKKLGEIGSRVTVIQGDATNPDAIAQAVANADAVVSTLGHSKGSPDDVLAVAASHMVTAMRGKDVKRLVILANTSLSDGDDKPTFVQRLMGKIMNVVIGKINRDHAAQAQLISKSGLDWTLVRATTLTDGPHSGKYIVGHLDEKSGSKIARADVADFMLKSAANGQYVRRMPVISQ